MFTSRIVIYNESSLMCLMLLVGNMKEAGSSAVKVAFCCCCFVVFSLRNLPTGCKHTESCLGAFVQTTDAVVLLVRKVSLQTVFRCSFITVVNLAALCPRMRSGEYKRFIKKVDCISHFSHTTFTHS